MICESLEKALQHDKLRLHLKPSLFIEGVVFAVSSSPDIPMPEQWMPWALDGLHDVPVSKDSVDQLAMGLINQLQWQLSQMKDKQPLLPKVCQWSDNKEARLPLEQWLNGLLFGHQQLEENWQIAWDNKYVEDGESRLTRCLKCFTVLADTELALSSLEKEKQHTLKQNLPILYKQLNGLLQDYVNLAGELAEKMPGQIELYNQKDLTSFNKA